MYTVYTAELMHDSHAYVPFNYSMHVSQQRIFIDYQLRVYLFSQRQYVAVRTLGNV